VCACVCAFVCTRMRACVRACVHACVRARVHSCVGVCSCVCVRACVDVCMCVGLCLCVCVCIPPTPAFTFKRMYSYNLMHTPSPPSSLLAHWISHSHIDSFSRPFARPPRRVHVFPSVCSCPVSNIRSVSREVIVEKSSRNETFTRASSGSPFCVPLVAPLAATFSDLRGKFSIPRARHQGWQQGRVALRDICWVRIRRRADRTSR